MYVSWELSACILGASTQCELWKHNFHVYVIDSYLFEDQEQMLSFPLSD